MSAVPHSFKSRLRFGVLLLGAGCAGLPLSAWAAQKKLRFTTQIGMTQTHYSESPEDVMAEQLTPHIKLGSEYGLIQDRLDLGLSGYISGFANLSTHLRGTTDPATYWGVSLRTSLSLARKNSTWDFRIAPGYSTWGMIVPDQAYGAKLLGAPHLIVSLRNRKSGRRPWALSIKLAPTSTDFNLLNRNRELALGGEIMISKPQARRPLVLTLDIAETLYTRALNATAEQSLSFLSASLGVLIRW